MKKEIKRSYKRIIAVLSVIVLFVLTVSGCGKNDKISKAIDELQAKNPYIQLMIGENQYIYLLYNSKGEVVAESSSGGLGFYRNDNKLITLTDEAVNIETDLNPIQFIRCALDTAKNTDNCSIENESVESTSEDNTIESELYTITINGKDNIKKLYDSVGDEEYSKSSMEMLYSGFENVTDSRLVVKVSIGKDGEFGAACDMVFKNEGEEEQNYTSWLFDGYASTFDWELGNDWYTNDTSNVEEWIDRCNDKITEISDKMTKYIEDNGLNNSEEQSVETNDTVDGNTEQTTDTVEAVENEADITGAEVVEETAEVAE